MNPDTNKSPPLSPPSPLHPALLIFTLAAAIRLLYLYESSDSPTFFNPIIDAATYCDLAHAALTTGQFSPTFFWQPFFYPAFLLVTFALGNESLLVAKILQALIGAATCVLTYQLARRLFATCLPAPTWSRRSPPDRWAILAGLFAACYGPLIFYDGELLGTGWETFWAPALLLCLMDLSSALSASPRETPLRSLSFLRPWITLGLASSVAILTRPTYIPFVVIASLYALWQLARTLNGLAPSNVGASLATPVFPTPVVPRKQARLRLAAAAAALIAAILLPLLPASLLSHHQTGSYSILPYSGGLNLYIGNNPNARDTIAIRPGWAWDALTLLPARYGIAPGRETSHFFSTQARKFAQQQPLNFLHGLLEKSIQHISSRELPRNEDIYVYREWSGTLAALVWKIGPFGFPFGLLFPLALLGLWSLRRPSPPPAPSLPAEASAKEGTQHQALPLLLSPLAPLTLFLILYTAAVVLVFPSARYRMPLVPILIICATAGLASLATLWTTHRRRALATLLGMILLAALISLPGPFPQENAPYRAELNYCLGARELNRENLERARELLTEAVTLDPSYADAHNSLGVALERLARRPDAIAAYRQAATLNPKNLTARMNLGGALFREQAYPEAATEFAAVAAIAPRHVESRKQLAMTFIARGLSAESIPHFYDALALNPNDAAVHNNLGSALNATGDTVQAVKHFEAAILLDPDLDLAIDNLGAMLTGHGQLPQARLLYRAALARAATQNAPARITHFQQKLDALK